MVSYTSALSAISVLFAFIGLYFVTRIWFRWKTMSIEVIKARVFLNKRFLELNWAYVFLAGSMLTLHQLLEYLMYLNYLNRDFSYLSETLEFLALVFLVVLAYLWFKLLFPRSLSEMG